VADQPSRAEQTPLSARLLFLAGGLAFALTLGEGLTRFLVPDPSFRSEGALDMFRKDPFVGFRNKPNVREYLHGFIRVETNSLGFRGPEISTVKPPGTFRIVGLGDSVTWGVGVQEPDTFLAVLAQKLQRKSGPNTAANFEAINTAVIGYSTYQELVTLERYGLPLCPDLVIVGFVFNDAYPTVDPFGNVNTFHQPVNPRARFASTQVTVHHWQLLALLRSVIKRQWRAWRSQPSEVDDPNSGSWMANSFETESWPILQAHLRKLKSLGDANGFQVLVLLFPTYPQVYYSQTAHSYQNFVGPFVDAAKIPYIDLYGVFRAARIEPQFRDWSHPSAAGHRTTASEVLRYLEEVHWLDRQKLEGRPAACGAPGGQVVP
jgi:lysophospholipase L1-like esterase